MNIRLKTHVYIYDLKKKWYPFYWYIHAYKSTIEIRLNFTIAFKKRNESKMLTLGYSQLMFLEEAVTFYSNMINSIEIRSS